MIKILINLAQRRLYLYNKEQIQKSYPVAIGKPATPTPVGTFTVVHKIINPHLKVLGTRWIGLSKPSYGIHGTNNPASIGTMASLGCVRMYNRDVEEIFPQVPIGTTVEIISGVGGSTSGSGQVQAPGGTVGNDTQRYIVQKGDTLWRLSRRFGVPMDALIKANNLSNPDVLREGQELIIPNL